ncbi:antigen 5 like allergen Cul n 1-like [Drosophila innubila]|uniref:antigen 5 like allergen Cul n 1-like n=1 Tax=Drosophila innubila TaxID=198719 RepID=UPI00148E2D64|nr:antigen 5 like allergen Cul n 1-like [Drosophila innubila]
MTCRDHCLLYALIVVIGLVRIYALPDFCTIKTEYDDAAPDYCEEREQPHLGCNNKNKFAAACGEHAEIFPMTDNVKRLIVRQHNVYRNIVAQRSLHLLPTASRMLKVKWDTNLAQLAEYAVKKCSIKRPTSSFSTTMASKPGFNAIYNKYPKQQEQDEIKILGSQLKAWYDEYRRTTTESLLSGRSPDGRDVSHFIQLITGLNDRVGCAIVKYEQDKWKIQLMICLYGCYKQNNQVTYAIGYLPGDKCKCGSDRQFKNLCSNEETVGDCAMIKNHNLVNEEFEPTTTTTATRPKIRKTRKRSPIERLIDWIARQKISN